MQMTIFTQRNNTFSVSPTKTTSHSQPRFNSAQLAIQLHGPEISKILSFSVLSSTDT